MLRDRHFSIATFHYSFTAQSVQRDRPYVDLLRQYFVGLPIAIAADGDRSPNITAMIHPEIQYGTGPTEELIMPRLGRQQYALIVPNWWHIDRQGGHPQRGRQTMAAVFALGALLLGALAAVRGVLGATDRGRLALDMWARVLGMAGADAATVRGRSRVRTAVRLVPLVLGSVWGLLNGITMTTLLLDVALSAVWTPVFSSIEDVCARSEMTFNFDEGIMFHRFCSMLDRMQQ